MKITIISVAVAVLTAIAAYILMLIFATGMYIETVGNIIVLSSIETGIATALILLLQSQSY